MSAAIRRYTKSDAESQDATFEEMKKHLSLLRPVAEEARKGYADFRTASVNLKEESSSIRPRPIGLPPKPTGKRPRPTRRPNSNGGSWTSPTTARGSFPSWRRGSGGLDAVTADAAKMERFLTETNRFLGDFESFLKLYPGNQTLELRRNYRTQLDTYKKAFEEMLKNMDAFTDKLKAESGSAKLQTERAKAGAMEVVAREQEAGTLAERRNAQITALLRPANESQLLKLHSVYTAVLQNPRSLSGGAACCRHHP